MEKVIDILCLRDGSNCSLQNHIHGHLRSALDAGAPGGRDECRDLLGLGCVTLE